MIFLGIILALLAAIGAVAVVAEGGNHHTALTLFAFGKHLPTTSEAGVFLVGAATACVFLLGCSIAVSGFRRGARVRRELRDLRDEHDENLQAVIAEKANLERQLARERRIAARPGPGGGAGADPFPGSETGPMRGDPGRGLPPGPVFPGPGGPSSTATGQLFRRHAR